MNRSIFCLLMVFFVSIGYSQKIARIDFDEIRKAVSDSTSANYYPALVARVLDLDTTLTAEEYKYLYYGNVFQSYYHPYGATDKQREFREKYNIEDGFRETEQLGLEVLRENPVNLKVLLKMIFLYNKNERKEKATVYAKIYVSFLEVIYASGTGKNCENGFVVISVDDEYRIAGNLGLTVVQQALVGECDRLKFSRKGQKRRNRIKELYFNVRMPLTYLSKSFDKSDLPEPDIAPDEEE